MTGFQMWDFYRQSLLAEHRFYVEQAKKRLLSQFDNLEAEANLASAEYLEIASQHFNPDTHDPSEALEAAYDASQEFYQSLSRMHETTRLSVISGMFYEWDKKLREWLVREMRFRFRGEHTARAIWRVDFRDITDLLVAMGFDVRSLPFYEKLNALRLVVNVFKHGAGTSFNELKALFPEYMAPIVIADLEISWPADFRDHTDMQVSDQHLIEFSDAIRDFWMAVPADMPVPDSWDVPSWFEKAVMKDQGAP